MTDTAFGDEPPTDGAPDPLRPAFEAVAAATDPRSKLEALKRAAIDLAIPIRHGMLDGYEIEERLIDLADSHGLIAELTPGVVELVITNALNTPALPTEPSPIERVNGHAADEPPPPSGPADYGLPPDQPPPVGEVIVAPKPLIFTTADLLEGADIPRRRWLVCDRIPMRVVTILSGDGASGKTTILLQLCDAVVRGTDWLSGVIEEVGPVMFVTAEEDGDEIHRRLAAINIHTGRSFAELGGLHFVCLPGEDAALATAGRDGILRPSRFFDQLEAEAKKLGPKLIAIEAAADVYGGDENNRGQVRQFVQLLRRLAIGADAAVVLIQHPSVSGLAEGQGRSGSTAWRNSARSQLYFAGAKSSRDSDEPEGDVRELRVVKANYARTGETVQVRWQRGVFVPVASPTSLDRMAADAEVDVLFMRLLEQANAQGRGAGPNKGPNYAPARFEAMPGANGTRSHAFAVAMERLLSAGKICVETIGSPTRQRSRLIVGQPTNTPTNREF
jgi:RecA-family ATPase